jgi:hypothetical protein
VGNSLLWGTRAWSIVGDLQPRLFLPTTEIVPLSGGSPRVAELGHAATHVAEVDGHALVIGSDKWHLHMSLLALSGEPRVLAKHVERDAARTLRRFGAVETLAGVGDGRWFAAQIARETGGTGEPAEALLPLHCKRPVNRVVASSSPAPYVFCKEDGCPEASVRRRRRSGVTAFGVGSKAV